MNRKVNEPIVRDYMGRTVRVGDAVRILLDPQNEFSNDDPNEHPVVNILPQEARVTLWNGQTVSTSLIELRFGHSDACDAIIAERDLLTKADKKDADALYELGLLYQPVYWRNEEGEIDRFEEHSWFERAAIEGHAAAQFEHGFEFDFDQPDEVREAFKWFIQASENGHAEACMELAEIYTVYQADEPQAVRWYRRGRELGASHDISKFVFFCGIDKPLEKNYQARLERNAYRSDKQAQYSLAHGYALGETFPLSLPDAYAWAAIAIDYSEYLPAAADYVCPEEHWGGYGKPERLARLLANVLSKDEMQEARESHEAIAANIRKPRFFGLL